MGFRTARQCVSPFYRLLDHVQPGIIRVPPTGTSMLIEERNHPFDGLTGRRRPRSLRRVSCSVLGVIPGPHRPGRGRAAAGDDLSRVCDTFR